MYIQIDNAGFINKGAELMLLAIIDRVKKEDSLKPKFVKGANCQGTPEQIMQAGLFQIVNLQRYKVKWENHFDQKRLEPYGLAKKESVNLILDAGGFQFGDQWAYGYSKESNQKICEYYKGYKKQGTKVIFLPQAFGPFKQALALDRIQRVAEYAELIYAREQTSYNYLKVIFGTDERIRLAPDFTILIEPLAHKKLVESSANAVCLIPNARMTDKTDSSVANSYQQYLLETAEMILSRNEKLVLLNHEGNGDWKLIQSIQQKLGENNSQIIALNNLNALEVKAVIGSCKLLITSRFHGLVSGLNQQVPSLCTSWNHKYEELLNDYVVHDNILDTTDKKSYISKIDNALTKPKDYTPKPETINQLKNKTEKMWQEIIKAL